MADAAATLPVWGTSPAWDARLDDCVVSIALSPDGGRVAFCSAAGEILVCDAGVGSGSAKRVRHGTGAMALGFSAAGQVVSGGEDGRVRVWGADGAALAEHDVAACAASAGASGGSLGVRGAGGAWVMNVSVGGGEGAPTFVATVGSSIVCGALSAGAEMRRLGPLEKTVDCACHLRSEDGEDGGVIAACYGGVAMWETEAAVAANERRELRYKGWFICLAPSPDGKWIAGGCNDMTVRLWRRADGQDLQCGGYARKIAAIVWDASGRFLATAGGDQATIWDFSGDGPAGSTPVVAMGLQAAVSALAWSDMLLAVGAEDGAVIFFDVTNFRPGNARLGKPHLCSPIARWKSTRLAEASRLKQVTSMAWTQGGRGSTLFVGFACGLVEALRIDTLEI